MSAQSAKEKLEALRAAWSTQDTNNNDNNNFRPSNYFPFYRMELEESATVRFLPDGNEDNPMGFVVEKLMHPLFINGEKKNVPCLKMYDEDCPICAVSSAFYKEEGKKSINGKKYWRKKQHLAQALVITDPLPADKETGETHEGQLRFLNIGWQLYGVINEAFKSGDLDAIPYDTEDGCNFTIKKSEQGEYPTYALGSRFARKNSALTEEQLAIVAEKSVDLSTLLPPKPDLAKVEAMLEAALTGADYSDADHAAGDKDGAPAPTVKAETPAVADADDEVTPVAKGRTKLKDPTPATEDEDEEVDELLAAIQRRRANRDA